MKRRIRQMQMLVIRFVFAAARPCFRKISSLLLSFKGMCQPRKMGTVGAEPFSAKLRYTGADDPKHPNLIKVTVTMPHIDGR